MKKKTKRVAFLNMGIFPGITLFSIGFGKEELAKHLHRAYKGKADNWAAGLLDSPEMSKEVWGQAEKLILTNKKTKEETILFYIRIRDFNFSDSHYANLAHEILHIVNFHLRDILDRDREHEAEAYLHTHLMEQALKEIREIRKQKRK